MVGGCGHPPSSAELATVLKGSRGLNHTVDVNGEAAIGRYGITVSDEEQT